MDDQDYITLSENEDSSDEITEITPIPLAKKRGRPPKSSKILGKQKMTSKQNERGEGILVTMPLNMEYIPPTESITSDNKSKAIQSTMSNINGQKEKELSLLRWILLTTQPLSTVIHKAYIEHMRIIDPLFTVPGEKKIRMMIARSYGYNRDKLKLLLKTAQSISLTTDLWSSHSKHGYLAITEAIKKAIQKWEIESQVISITTDNGANMVAAIRNLAPIKRLSCAAHTLQLAINKGLKVVEDLVLRVKQLINFFSTQKQIERLIKVQKDIGYEETYHLIQDISTSTIRKATRDFSGSTYITLSQMFPIITNLTNSLKPIDNLHEENEDSDNNTITSDTEENITNQQTEIDYNNISEVLKM
ncbi:unnamed protein product [Rhizophagus irregularis]|nr:unnamed protein product [Rhizophagus irregularis]